MAIYDSTPSSSVLDLLSSAVVPNRHRVRSSSAIMDRSIVAVSSPGSSAVQFNKAALGWTACVGISLLILNYIGSRKDTTRRLLSSPEETSDGTDCGVGWQVGWADRTLC